MLYKQCIFAKVYFILVFVFTFVLYCQEEQKEPKCPESIFYCQLIEHVADVITCVVVLLLLCAQHPAVAAAAAQSCEWSRQAVPQTVLRC